MPAEQILSQLYGNANPIEAFTKGAQLRATLDLAQAHQVTTSFEMMMQGVRRNDENRRFDATLSQRNQEHQDQMIMEQQKLAETARMNDARLGEGSDLAASRIALNNAHAEYYGRMGTGATGQTEDDRISDLKNTLYPESAGTAQTANGADIATASASDFANRAEQFKSEHGVYPNEAVDELKNDPRPAAINVFNKAKALMDAGAALGRPHGGPQTPQEDAAAYQQRAQSLPQLAAATAPTALPSTLLPPVDAATLGQMKNPAASSSDRRTQSQAALAEYEKRQSLARLAATGTPPQIDTRSAIERLAVLNEALKNLNDAPAIQKKSKQYLPLANRIVDEHAKLMNRPDVIAEMNKPPAPGMSLHSVAIKGSDGSMRTFTADRSGIDFQGLNKEVTQNGAVVVGRVFKGSGPDGGSVTIQYPDARKQVSEAVRRSENSTALAKEAWDSYDKVQKAATAADRRSDENAPKLQAEADRLLKYAMQIDPSFAAQAGVGGGGVASPQTAKEKADRLLKILTP